MIDPSATAFDRAFERTLGHEGGFSNDPQDSGGATRFGITEAVARAAGYTGAIGDLPPETAKSIARSQYWGKLKLDHVAARSESIALELFDTGYNMGIGAAGKFLQIALNAFNRQGADYADIATDGQIGQGTLAALDAYLGKRGNAGEVVLVRALNALQGAEYIAITARRQKDEKYAFGWFLNRVSEA